MGRNYEYKKEIKSARWLLFGVILFLFTADVIFEAAVSFMSAPPHEYVRMAIVEMAALLLPLIILRGSSLKKYNTVKRLRLNKMTFTQVVFTILLGAGGQFVMMILNLPLQYLCQVVFHMESSSQSLGALSVPAVFGGIIAVGILPAVLEEFWMRGLVFEVYNRVGTACAVLFTTFIFAVFHGKPQELLGYIFMGFSASFVMIMCNSLYAAILYHLSSNLTALLFSIVIMDLVDYLWLIILLMILLFFVVLILFLRKKPAMTIVKDEKGMKVFWRSLFSVPIILSICIVILKYWLIYS